MNREHSGLRSAAVFSLCGLFAVLAMGVTLLAAGVYRTVTVQGDRNDTRRTALSYLVNQTRRADQMGGIEVTDFGGDALELSEEVDGVTYVTLIYCYEGQLRELYMEADAGLGPEEGIPILKLKNLKISTENKQITFTITDGEGDISSASITPQCGFEEVGGL